jgi:hypothetical protein
MIDREGIDLKFWRVMSRNVLPKLLALREDGKRYYSSEKPELATPASSFNPQ